MDKPFTENFKSGFLIALYEYFIVTMPIGIYVSLEALHREDWHYLYTTPEWAIATIFLSFISLSRYIATIGKNGRQFEGPIIGLFGLFILILIIASTINANISISCESFTAILCRIVLFIVSTGVFFIFMTITKLLKN